MSLLLFIAFPACCAVFPFAGDNAGLRAFRGENARRR